ncbi:FBD domain-containing protein [Heracleum sosnowskyi]|uniref:FBD domain-containing protein n=1 Tax=Heracleum sosnowskyi TaxID=360622 RepID=A0AAD8GX45_9APIA|nr:FBD domain-containing protein [Heracleum sosnowskyi]
MVKSSRRKVRRVKKDIMSEVPQEDIISELPQHIRESIVGFLPIRDAVRTSVLSRKWRHCWTMIPDLIFDDEFVDGVLDKLRQCDDPEVKSYKLVSVINRVLLLHNGPILKFFFYSCDNECNFQIIHDYIDQWIPLLARNGTKQLVLEDLEIGEFSAHHFSSIDLTHLKLTNFWFPYAPTFGTFPYLTNLELVQVELIDLADSKQKIFNCPVLEKLKLILCNGIFPTNFCAPKLKCLHQLCNEITSEFSLAGLENLSEYSFGLLEKSRTLAKKFNVDKILGSLPKIEKFCIAMEFMQYLAAGRSPKTLSKSLPYLKILNISDILFNKSSEVSCLLCLIRSAPNLCNLNISAEYFVEGDLKKYRIIDSKDCTMDHLEIVTFRNFKGLRAELELVKFLLARSPLLKTMFINYSGTLEKDAALMMFKEMLKYSKASSTAQIRRLKYPFEMDDFGAYYLQYC